MSARSAGQAATEYILILFLSLTAIVAVFKVLRPVFNRLVSARSQQLEQGFSRGVYQYRIPSR
jgi:hypothetical protein